MPHLGRERDAGSRMLRIPAQRQTRSREVLGVVWTIVAQGSFCSLVPQEAGGPKNLATFAGIVEMRTATLDRCVGDI